MMGRMMMSRIHPSLGSGPNSGSFGLDAVDEAVDEQRKLDDGGQEPEQTHLPKGLVGSARVTRDSPPV
jgi:hypothetical protein